MGDGMVEGGGVDPLPTSQKFAHPAPTILILIDVQYSQMFSILIPPITTTPFCCLENPGGGAQCLFKTNFANNS